MSLRVTGWPFHNRRAILIKSMRPANLAADSPIARTVIVEQDRRIYVSSHRKQNASESISAAGVDQSSGIDGDQMTLANEILEWPRQYRNGSYPESTRMLADGPRSYASSTLSDMQFILLPLDVCSAVSVAHTGTMAFWGSSPVSIYRNTSIDDGKNSPVLRFPSH